MKITMQSQMARIAMRTTPAQQEIEQPSANFEMKTTHAKVEITSTLPKVNIDQIEAFNESGLKTFKALTADMAAKAKSIMQENIGRIVEQGNQMADIQSGADVVAETADDNAFGQFAKEFGMVTMPTSGPDITLQEGQVDIQVNEGDVEVNSSPNKPIHNYQRGKLEIYLEQMNSLEIDVVEEHVDLKG